LRSIKRSIKKKIKLLAIRRLDVFSPVIEDDYFLVKESISSLQPKYLSWNYDISFSGFVNDGDKLQDNYNILLGNSATYTNNHLDCFEVISKIDLNNRKIICPLNYGDKEHRKDLRIQ